MAAAMLVSQNEFYNTAKGLIGQDVRLFGSLPLQEKREDSSLPPFAKGDRGGFYLPRTPPNFLDAHKKTSCRAKTAELNRRLSKNHP